MNKKRVKRYDLGEFVTKNTDGIAGAGTFLSGALNSMQSSNKPDAGLSAASGALGLGAQGLAIGGPWGAAIGGVAGAISGLVSAGARRRAYERKRTGVIDNIESDRVNNLTTTNVDPYGTQMYADGDMVEDGDPLKKYLTKQIPTRNTTSVVPTKIKPALRNIPGIPIKQRDDFESNSIGRDAVKDRINDEYYKGSKILKPYNKLSDLYNYFSGQPLKNDVLSISGTKPTNSKDPDAKYLSISDKEFQQQVIDNYNRVSSGNLKQDNRNLKSEQKTGKDTYNISAYDQPTGGTLGHYTVSKGKDEKGDYISYYDKFDIDVGTGKNIVEKMGILKPFEVYDRIYLDKKGNPIFNENTPMKKAIKPNYELGDLVEGDKPPKRSKYSGKNQLVQKAVNASYDPSLLIDGAFHVSPNGVPVPWGKDPSLHTDIQGVPQVLPSQKAVGLNNTFFPSNMLPQGKDVPTQYPSRRYADGDTVEDNYINIEKNELLIDPKDGKIIQEYNGINPLTGGLFEPHAKGNKTESNNNITIAEPGTFVITRKRSKQYKDAVDNNDKITKDTVLMNIRNNKIDKEGGLKPKQFAYGGDTDNELPNGVRAPNPYANIPISGANEYNRMFNIPQEDLVATKPGNVNTTFNIVPQSSNISPTTISSPNSSGSGTGFFDKALNYAPAATNIFNGLFGSTETINPVAKLNNPYLSKIIGNIPKDINMQPIVNEINSNQAVANKDLLNNTNNSAVYRANRQQLASNTSKQLTNVRLQAQQANNQNAAQRSNIYAQLGQEDLQQQNIADRTNLINDRENIAAKAAKQNILNTGISQLQQIGQNEKYNKSKQAMDKYSLDLMAQIFPNLKYYDQFNAEDLFKKLR